MCGQQRRASDQRSPSLQKQPVAANLRVPANEREAARGLQRVVSRLGQPPRISIQDWLVVSRGWFSLLERVAEASQRMGSGTNTPTGGRSFTARAFAPWKCWCCMPFSVILVHEMYWYGHGVDISELEYE